MSEMILVREPALEAATFAALREGGADERSAGAATRAMMHASRIGVDSHGVRLTAHYVKALQGSRINGAPNMEVRRTAASSAVLDADDGLGHAAAYEGMKLACAMAKDTGVAAVGILRSSHYGAGGAYALAGAEEGMISLSMTQSDAVVALHGGAERFHGTNPIAVGAPVPGERPWLLDMATSSIPFNRVLLYRTLGKTLSDGVAADASGQPTTDPNAADMLMPLGGVDFGFKGAGLAGLVTLFSSILTGSTLDHLVIRMAETDDFQTPRNLGHFCLAIDPDRFVGRQFYETAIMRYLVDLRSSVARTGETVMAPGDREWAVEQERQRTGIPVDPETARFLRV
ncbi:Ldh family oxidoreductase [Microvirga aerophila]|uniref:Oxidoreductase n=1 Tax=Microvirga aerophila TaxID=670291 RepID=A0A512BSC7_9HYPH|nr:oxidoreductase [Microvirga aerophila]